MEKREVLLIVLAAVLLISVSGCLKKTTITGCDSPDVVIGERCCIDANGNGVCDDQDLKENISTEGVCGNSICENETENCTACWKDCGACKKVVYIYVPRNFTMVELKSDLDALGRDGIKFRKDINALNNVSNFFYFSEPVPRHIAEFMGIRYSLLKESRVILLSHVFLDSYYVNSSSSLLSFVNFSNWYITHTIRAADMTEYETRISSGKSKEDYPTQPTGYQKEFRYDDWDFRNYTKHEDVIYDYVRLLDNDTAEAVFASITEYNVTYMTHYYDNKEFGVKESFSSTEEKRLGYTHSLSFACSRNLVITLYDYSYDTEHYGGMGKDTIDAQLALNRARLGSKAAEIGQLCESKYSNKIFTYS
jgi:hypothetical protein